MTSKRKRKNGNTPRSAKRRKSRKNKIQGTLKAKAPNNNSTSTAHKRVPARRRRRKNGGKRLVTAQQYAHQRQRRLMKHTNMDEATENSEVPGTSTATEQTQSHDCHQNSTPGYLHRNQRPPFLPRVAPVAKESTRS